MVTSKQDQVRLTRPGRAVAAVKLDPAQAMSVAGYTPDAWQVELIRSATTNPQTIVVTSRQSGKTTSVSALIAAELIRRSGTRILCLAPSQRQSSLILERVGEFLAPYGMAATRSSRSEIQLVNGSVVYAVPSSSSTIRGYHAIDLLALDEAAWIPEPAYAVVRPMRATVGGRIVATSTPGGQRGWYWQAWDAEDGWYRIEVPCTRVHRLDADFLRSEAHSVPPSVFRSEYMCSFEDSNDALFLPAVLRRADVLPDGAEDIDVAGFAQWLRSQDQPRER